MLPDVHACYVPEPYAESIDEIVRLNNPVLAVEIVGFEGLWKDGS